jgi:DNA-binding NtrC family response regulator
MLDLAVHVSHFPPGTSKWNKVEHRLFSYISINWRGRPLRTYETITAADLMLRPRGDAAPRLEDMTLDEVERYLIERTLAAQGGNVSEAARALGLSRSALYRRLASLGIRS